MNIYNEEGVIDSEVEEILYELGNVGLGMASIAMGRMMGVRLNIGVPKIIPAENMLPPQAEIYENDIVMQMDFQKTMTGCMLLAVKQKFINEVVQKIGQTKEVITDEGDKESVIQEFANMICAAYLKAVGQYTGVRMYIKPAGLKRPKESEDLERLYKDIVNNRRRVICVDTGFSIVCENGEVIDDVGRVMMLPDEISVEKLIEPLCD